ncbi:MAG: DUF11 domain-containing protein [Bacteroidetes bacterium]|nr:DUF11 domain-containing protein [Bacteroidota bacterium]
MSECNDCFTITKTANTTSINAYDTITYTITVTANNGSAQTVTVSDLFPNNFYVVGVNPFPATINLAAQGIQIFTVQGYFTATNGCDSTYNLATLTNGGSVTIKDSVCVEVNTTCFTPGMTIFPDPTDLKTIGSTFANDTFYVAGVLLIENMSATFTNCVIYCAAGANIIVNLATLTLNNTNIIACDSMWKEITLIADAWIITDNSNIEDAHIGINHIGNGGFKIQNSNITNNVIGINVPLDSLLQHTQYIWLCSRHKIWIIKQNLLLIILANHHMDYYPLQAYQWWI